MVLEAEIIIYVIIVLFLFKFARICALGFALYTQNIEIAHLSDIANAIKSCRLSPSPLNLQAQ